MPFAAPAALVPLISFLATPITIGGIATGLTIGGIAATAALSGAAFVLNQALQPKIKNPGIDEGQKQVVQQAVPTQRLIYGRALVGGPMFFYECKPPYLYVGLVLASHEIDALEKVYVNGVEVTFDGSGAATSVNFNNGTTPYIYRSVRLGTATQAQDPLIAADFPEIAADTNWRQKGHATIVLKCLYGQGASAADRAEDHEQFWGSGAPQFLFLVRGMKVYDPREATHSSSNPSTWAWSDNASLCLAHYLTFAKGCRRSWSDIDIDALRSAAENDHRSISLASGGVEKRYSVNGIVDLAADPSENVLNMLTANLGKLSWAQGNYQIRSGVAQDAVWTLNDKSARGEMAVRMHRERAGLVNVVRTVFAASDREYQTSNGPVLRNATYIEEDGEEHEITITLPFTSTHTTAQRIAKATMERSRLGKLITRKENLSALRLGAADVINVDVGFMTAFGGQFEVNKVSLDHETFECEIELEQFSSSIFAWTTAEEQSFVIEPAELAGVN